MKIVPSISIDAMIKYRDVLYERYLQGVKLLDKKIKIDNKKFKDLVVNINNTNNIILQIEAEINTQIKEDEEKQKEVAEEMINTVAEETTAVEENN